MEMDLRNIIQQAEHYYLCEKLKTYLLFNWFVLLFFSCSVGQNTIKRITTFARERQRKNKLKQKTTLHAQCNFKVKLEYVIKLKMSCSCGLKILNILLKRKLRNKQSPTHEQISVHMQIKLIHAINAKKKSISHVVSCRLSR